MNKERGRDNHKSSLPCPSDHSKIKEKKKGWIFGTGGEGYGDDQGQRDRLFQLRRRFQVSFPSHHPFELAFFLLFFRCWLLIHPNKFLIGWLYETGCCNSDEFWRLTARLIVRSARKWRNCSTSWAWITSWLNWTTRVWSFWSLCLSNLFILHVFVKFNLLLVEKLDFFGSHLSTRCMLLRASTFVLRFFYYSTCWVNEILHFYFRWNCFVACYKQAHELCWCIYWLYEGWLTV